MTTSCTRPLTVITAQMMSAGEYRVQKNQQNLAHMTAIHTHNSFKTVGKSMFDIEVMTQVWAVSIQDEVLQTKFLHKRHD